VVVALGGGSAVDAGKAVSGLLANGGAALDYLEVVGRGQKLARPAVPFIAVPTTAGTGAEVTRNAVLAVPEHRVKASLRSPYLLPRVALVDPQLTHSLPPAITASTGLDALTQLLEAYVSRRANPLTDALARAGLPRVVPALRRAYHDGSDAAARTEMSLASLLSGLALANAGLGAVHGFAAPLSGAFLVPHGVACAALLPYVVECNVRALQAREPDNPALAKHVEALACLLGQRLGSDAETLAAGVTLLYDLCAELAVPSLARFSITAQDVPALVSEAERASSMKANPITLTTEELAETLGRAVGLGVLE
jgi:alcohol dehydrogenase class IV